MNVSAGLKRLACVMAAAGFSCGNTTPGSPALLLPSRANDQFMFHLRGQSKVGYVIFRSADLSVWTPVLTNLAMPSSESVITLDAQGERAFLRALQLPAPECRFALAVRSQTDLNGNDLVVDSFDSMDGAYSTGGRYDNSKHKDQGDLAAHLGLTNSLNVGNADIFGRVSTGPGASVSIGPNGAVGNMAWHASQNKGIQPGSVADDMNVNFPDVGVPFSGGAFVPSPGVLDGEVYSYVLGNGNYYLNSLSMSGSNRMIVTANAVLYVASNVSVAGRAAITIASNATLKLYVGGGSASLAGNGVVNRAGNATNFFYYGLPGNTNLNLTVHASFVGVVYAPSADMTISASPTGPAEYVGACAANSLRLDGALDLHYDENLLRAPPLNPDPATPVWIPPGT